MLYVHLWSLPNPVILVPASTGITYCNQVDGVSCVQRALEGFVIPLPEMSSHVFNPDWWEKHVNRGAAKADEWPMLCDAIEQAVRTAPSGGETVRELRVMRDASENAEAWVHVRFLLPNLGPDAQKATDWAPFEGILTWQNCD